MTVIYNTNFTHNPNSYLTLAIETAAKQVFGASNVVLADNRSLAPIAASGLHDVLICIDGQRLHESLLRRVRPAFGTLIMWQFEDPFMQEYNLQHASLFDHIFTNDPACVAAYGGKGHYLPLAASERLHFRPVKDDADLDYDIFFAGTMWPNRVRSLRRVRNAFPDARLKLVCPTNEYLPPLPSDLARMAIQWPVSHESFIDFANASRVTITMFRDYASHGDVGHATAPGPRLYELGLCGTAQVVHCGELIDSSHFDGLSGVDVVRDDASLVIGISRLLEDPDLRARRARLAQEQITDRHLYTRRLRRIAEVTNANFGVKAPVSRPVAGRRLRVLMCTHSTIHRSEWGGVEVYQQTLAAMLERDVEVFFWLRVDGQCQLVDSEGVVLERFDMPDVGWLDSLTDAPEEMAFSNVISQYGVDLVHFQHLGHHAASLPIIAKASGVGTVFSAHDFFLVCARYNLLNNEQVYCDIGEKSISACDICLRISEGLPAGAQQTRRAFMVEVIRSIDVFLFGSPYSEELTLKIYPELAKHRRAVLGVPMPQITAMAPPAAHEDKDDAPLVIAIVGNFLRPKGADAVMSLIEEANPELFHFHILGNAEAHYAEVMNRWNRPNVTYHGRYAPTDLARIANADVSLHLSIWPETYCISLSETWQKGLIPIVSDIGALGDRVTHGVNGFKVDIGNVSAVLDHLEFLRASPAKRREMRANITPHLWTDYREYATSLLEIYRSVSSRLPLGGAGLGLDVGQVHLLPHSSWKVLAPPRHIFDPSRRSSIILELPPAIQDWSYIQGSELHIDSVCGFRPESLKEAVFKPSQDLHVRGWTFVPGVQVGGQIFIALIGDGEGPVIFFPASREIRVDIVSIFPGAPVRSGFEGRVALRGKWCEGRYSVAIVNSFGDRASFCLTGLAVEVKEGRITHVALDPPSNARTMAAFYRTALQTGEDYGIAIAKPQLDDDAAWADTAMAYCVDEVDTVQGGDSEPVDGDRRIFRMRGWAFVRGRGLAGQLYIGLVDLQLGRRVFVPIQRVLRGDVGTRHFDAPLCCGFEGKVELPIGWDVSDVACTLVNVIGGTASGQPAGIMLKVRGGRIVDIVRREFQPTEAEFVRLRLRGAHIAPIRPIDDAVEMAVPEPAVALPEAAVALQEPETALPEPAVAQPEPEEALPEPEEHLARRAVRGKSVQPTRNPKRAAKR